MTGPYELGTVAAAEGVLRDLYMALRTSIMQWAAVTQQTPQPKMGYIGQHLTSVVTAHPGGRSAARGKDLILPNGRYAEIKTCYRVDQLGVCLNCTHVVASIESSCPSCGSSDVRRRDDSKWLISPKHDADMLEIFNATAYYLVLFDFVDIQNPQEGINARIWEVDPQGKGFAYCLVDYYFNIKSKSRSGAPFNLWPFQLKFQLMRPELIYWSILHVDQTIETFIFPERDLPSPYPISPLTALHAGGVLNTNNTMALRHLLQINPELLTRSAILTEVEGIRSRGELQDSVLADYLAEAIYAPRIASHRDWLPAALR